MNALAPRAPVSRSAWLDASVTVLLVSIAFVGFTPAFGGWAYLGAAVGGVIVGGGAAVIGALYRLGVLSTTAVAVGAYFVFGNAFAMSSVAAWGFVPTVETLAGLVIGAVFGWADIVTIQTPVGAPAYINVVPYVASWAVSLISVTLALRWLPRSSRFTARRGAVVVLGPLVLLLVGILVGTDDPFFAAVRGLAFAAVVLIWMGWRARPPAEAVSTHSALVFRRKVVGTAVLVTASLAIGAVSGIALQPLTDDRFVVRDHVEPPFDLLEFTSPLTTFRNYSKVNTETVMFTVSGVTEGQPIRLATLDSFDGVIWSVAGAELAEDGAGTFELVGEQLPPPAANPSRSETVSIEVTVAAYSDVWLPSVGRPTSISFDGPTARPLAASLRYNIASGTAVVTAGLREGDRYVMQSLVTAIPNNLAEVSTAAVSVPPATAVQLVGAKALEFAGGATSAYEQLENISDRLSTEGYLRRGLAFEDPPTSRAGHGADRLVQLFSSSYMVGDSEQFASAFALMARSLGYPSRVVMGFQPPLGSTGTVSITGADVTAWVEVPFDGVGWVPFFPTPDQTEVPQDQVPQPQTKPQPQVRQPPRAIENPEALSSPLEIEDEEKEEDNAFSIPGWVWVVAAWTLIPATILLVPLLIVGLIKLRRRKRRRLVGTPVDRIAGGWDELVDSYAELGYPVTPRRTRTQLAEQLAASTTNPGAIVALAGDADRAVFSGRDRDPSEAQEFWAEATTEIERMTGSTSRWRRVVSRYYLRPRARI